MLEARISKNWNNDELKYIRGLLKKYSTLLFPEKSLRRMGHLVLF